MSEHCLRYEEVTSDQLGQRAAREMTYRFEPAHEPDDVVFNGPCPRCKGEMTYTWPLMVVRQTIAPEVEDQLAVTVICRCPYKHPGAGSEQGCGAYWNLRVPRPS